MLPAVLGTFGRKQLVISGRPGEGFL